MRFHEARGIGPETMAEIQAQVRHRLLSVLARRGVLEREDAEAMGSWDHGGGFSVDASVRIEAGDRLGLERLLRYCARPAFALDRLREIDAERLVYESVKPGAGGSVSLMLTPLELIERLAALIPPPRRHRHRYYGVLAPNAPLRSAVTALASPRAARCLNRRTHRRRQQRNRSTVARPVTPGRCCWLASMKSSPFSVRSALQTTYALRDSQSRVRVTHPPHPLFDQVLQVVGLRREGGQTYCDVLLADGSRLRLPADWTDHRAGRSRCARCAACTRTTPGALRELLCLLRALVNSNAAKDAQRRPVNQGDDDARAVPAVRNRATPLGAASVASARPRDAKQNHRDSGRDGAGELAPRASAASEGARR